MKLEPVAKSAHVPVVVQDWRLSLTREELRTVEAAQEHAAFFKGAEVQANQNSLLIDKLARLLDQKL